MPVSNVLPMSTLRSGAAGLAGSRRAVPSGPPSSKRVSRCIVGTRESSGRPGALSKVNSNGTRDHGLFQLNSIHVGRVIDADKVFDADANARAAFKLSHHGKNFSAWGIGHTGWAGHLERMQPATYAAYNARFQEILARFPG